MPAADLVAMQEAAQTLLAAAQAELGSGDWCLVRPEEGFPKISGTLQGLCRRVCWDM